jgi:Subtilase family
MFRVSQFGSSISKILAVSIILGSLAISTSTKVFANEEAKSPQSTSIEQTSQPLQPTTPKTETNDKPESQSQVQIASQSANPNSKAQPNSLEVQTSQSTSNKQVQTTPTFASVQESSKSITDQANQSSEQPKTQSSTSSAQTTSKSTSDTLVLSDLPNSSSSQTTQSSFPSYSPYSSNYSSNNSTSYSSHSSYNSSFSSDSSYGYSSLTSSNNSSTNTYSKSSSSSNNNEWWLGDKDGSNSIKAVEEMNKILSQKYDCPVGAKDISECKNYNKDTNFNIKIAIIDSGIDTNRIQGANFDKANEVTLTNSYDDPECTLSKSYDEIYVPNAYSVSFCKNTRPQTDEYGHGTFTADAAYQIFKNSLLANHITIIPIGMLSNFYFVKSVSDALEEAKRLGANIVNMSLGFPFGQNLFDKQIEDLTKDGAKVVVSSGNDGQFGNIDQYPGNNPNVFRIGATNTEIDRSIAKTKYSTSAPNLFVSGPMGDGIRLTCPIVALAYCDSDGKTYMEGTSFSAPQVSGTMALLDIYQQFMAYDTKTNNQLVYIDPNNKIGSSTPDFLAKSAKDVSNEGWDEETGNGLIDIFGATKLINSNFVTRNSEPKTTTPNVETANQPITNTPAPALALGQGSVVREIKTNLSGSREVTPTTNSKLVMNPSEPAMEYHQSNPEFQGKGRGQVLGGGYSPEEIKTQKLIQSQIQSPIQSAKGILTRTGGVN